jgi:5'-nucleotidase
MDLLDGYTSLLIEEEGGTAKEIVSEENGVLISTILRQYFMSLKILGKWKNWAPDMTDKFSKVQLSLQRKHTFHDPAPLSTDSDTSHSLPKRSNIAIPTSKQHHDGAQQDPDTDDEDYEYDDSELIRFNEHELGLLRKITRKWWRLAGLKNTPKCADEVGKEELRVDWTSAIAPRIEGRIKEINKS